ncbi:MAG: aromatic ring-hydroxylating dioxygenase subunit alpha [Spongiibacteraceae bacterium]|jgi:vanillate O-demethylase monooxygenase subunit|nr:aromatic ring-hydroxylating dioxygenase subunit alpha [Spongiibacteraceae bacterium]
MFVRNCWYVAAWDYEIRPGELCAITIINEPIVIYRDQDGRPIAMEDRCCHRFAPLSRGRIEDGCNIRCLYHGLKFDPRGQCIEIPGQDKIPSAARVTVYPVVEKHSWVWVWMGNPALADEALIPPAVGLDHPDWILRSGHMDYQANYLLINDNLTDFSHLSYVHANSFGATEAFAQKRPRVERLPRGIRVSRWMLNGEARKPDAGIRKISNLDNDETSHWSTYDFLAPGVLLMASEIHPNAAVPADRTSPPTTPPISASFTSQAVTPLTDKTSRYFFSWGPHRSGGTEEMAEQMFALAQRAFTEDLEMIEAQQRIIDIKPGTEVLTTADVGPVQMRNVMKELIAAEQRAPAPAEV